MNPQARLLIGSLLEQLGTIIGGFSGIAGFIVANQNGTGRFPFLAVVLIVLGTVLIVLSKTIFSNAWTELADREQERQIELAKQAKAAQAAEQRAKAREDAMVKEAEKRVPTALREALTFDMLLQETLQEWDDNRYDFGSYKHTQENYPELFDRDLSFEEVYEIIEDYIGWMG